MLETRKNDQHVRNEHRHEWRNKTRRESRAAKRSTYRRNTHHRSRATGRHCIHAMTARVRKRCAPTRGRTHTPPTGGIQAVNGEREATQQPPPNEQHSHADPDRQHHEQPNPAHRYSLTYSRLHGLVTKASSKSHSAFLRPLGSRFTEVSITRH